jgi:hypothetical protein
MIRDSRGFGLITHSRLPKTVPRGCSFLEAANLKPYSLLVITTRDASEHVRSQPPNRLYHGGSHGL